MDFPREASVDRLKLIINGFRAKRSHFAVTKLKEYMHIT